MSIIAASGPINWSQVEIPPGRSKQSCYLVYYHAREEAKKYKDAKGTGTTGEGMGDKSGSKNGVQGGGAKAGTGKRKRTNGNKKSAEQVEKIQEVEKSDDEAKPVKKEKVEEESDTAEEFEDLAASSL